MASFEYGKGSPCNGLTEMFPIVEVSFDLRTIYFLFQSILNVKNAALFEYYKEKAGIHTDALHS